jgi:hypothetical protein
MAYLGSQLREIRQIRRRSSETALQKAEGDLQTEQKSENRNSQQSGSRRTKRIQETASAKLFHVI